MINPLKNDADLTRLKCIEAILRNGLPHSNKDVVETIAHADSEVELLLESLGADGWAQ